MSNDLDGGWTAVAATSDVSDNDVKGVVFYGTPLAVFRIKGTFFCNQRRLHPWQRLFVGWLSRWWNDRVPFASRAV